MTDFASLASQLIKIGAPALGTAIGGPIGLVAGAAISALADALGTAPTPEAVATAIKTDPAAPAKVQQLEAARGPEFLAELQARLADVADARRQTVQLAESGSRIAWGAPVVSVIVVTGFFVVLGMLFVVKVELPTSIAQLLNVLFGALIPGFGQVINYWLGSSIGSVRSSDTLRSIAAGRK